MNSRGKVSWILVFGICVLIPVVKSQTQDCSIEGIDLLQCLSRGNRSSIDICCKALNQIVQAGYNCLCSLVSSSIPLLSTPISLPLSNCYIYVPPLTLCRAPRPVVLPPPTPKELTTPSSPLNVSLPPPPPPEMQVPSNSTTVDNSTTVAAQPHTIENCVPKSSVSESWNESSNGKAENKTLLSTSLLLSLALYVYVLLA